MEHVHCEPQALDGRHADEPAQLLEDEEGDDGVRADAHPVREEAFVQTEHALGARRAQQAVEGARVHLCNTNQDHGVISLVVMLTGPCSCQSNQ